MSPELSALSFRELGYLIALAREGHFRRAAETCFVTQPTLSAQVKKVEQVLGVQIFDRSHRQVRLTDAGKRVIDQAFGFCTSAGATPSAFQAASLETLRLLVAAGRGAALIPKLAVHGTGMSSRDLLAYVPFQEGSVGREITIYHRRNSSFGKDADILARLVADCVGL